MFASSRAGAVRTALLGLVTLLARSARSRSRRRRCRTTSSTSASRASATTPTRPGPRSSIRRSIDPGADLMLLHPDGSEEVLVAGGNGAVTDPFVSFDAQWVYYSYFPDVRAAGDQLPARPALRGRRHLPHPPRDARRSSGSRFGEFTPNTGAGNFDESNPVDPAAAVQPPRLRHPESRPVPGRRRQDRLHQQPQRLRAAARASPTRRCSSS